MTAHQATAARLTAVPLGLATTFFLLMLMASLIQTDFVIEAPPPPTPIADVVMPKLEIAPPIPKLERPDKPLDEPDTPLVDPKVQVEITDPVGPGFAPPRIDIASRDLNISQAGDYLPIVKVAPQYPRRALTRGLEGEVVVSFTVTTAGSTRDIQVVSAVAADGSPTSVFNRAAIKAAEGFKYKPRIEAGVAQEVHGVQNRFIFELNQ